MRKQLLSVAAILAAAPVCVQAQLTTGSGTVGSALINSQMNGVISLEGVSFNRLDVITINLDGKNGAKLAVSKSLDANAETFEFTAGQPFYVPGSWTGEGLKLYVSLPKDAAEGTSYSIVNVSFTKNVYAHFTTVFSADRVKNALNDYSKRAYNIYGCETEGSDLASLLEGVNGAKTELDGYNKDITTIKGSDLVNYFKTKAETELNIDGRIEAAQGKAAAFDKKNDEAKAAVDAKIKEANTEYNNETKSLEDLLLATDYEPDYAGWLANLRAQKDKVNDVQGELNASYGKDKTSDPTPADAKDGWLGRLDAAIEAIQAVVPAAKANIAAKEAAYQNANTVIGNLKTTLNGIKANFQTGFTGLAADTTSVSKEIKDLQTEVDEIRYDDSILGYTVSTKNIQTKLDNLSKAVSNAKGVAGANTSAQNAIKALYAKIAPAKNYANGLKGSDGKDILNGKAAKDLATLESNTKTGGAYYQTLAKKVTADKDAHMEALKDKSSTQAYLEELTGKLVPAGEKEINDLNTNATNAKEKYNTLKSAVAALNTQLTNDTTEMKAYNVAKGATNLYETEYKAEGIAKGNLIKAEDAKITTAVGKVTVKEVLEALKGVTIDPEVEGAKKISTQITEMKAAHKVAQDKANGGRREALALQVESDYAMLKVDFFAPVKKEDGVEGTFVGTKSYDKLLPIYTGLETRIQTVKDVKDAALKDKDIVAGANSLSKCLADIKQLQLDIDKYKKALVIAQNNFVQAEGIKKECDGLLDAMKSTLDGSLAYTEVTDDKGNVTSGTGFYQHKDVVKIYKAGIVATLDGKITDLRDSVQTAYDEETIYEKYNESKTLSNDINTTKTSIEAVDRDAWKAVEMQGTIQVLKDELAATQKKYGKDGAEELDVDTKNAIGYDAEITRLDKEITSLNATLEGYMSAGTVIKNSSNITTKANAISKDLTKSTGTLQTYIRRYNAYKEWVDLLADVTAKADEALNSDIDPIDLYVNQIVAIKGSVKKMDVASFNKKTAYDEWDKTKFNAALASETVQGSIDNIVAVSKLNRAGYDVLMEGQTDLEAYPQKAIDGMRPDAELDEAALKVKAGLVAEINGKKASIVANGTAIEEAYREGMYAEGVEGSAVAAQKISTAKIKSEITEIANRLEPGIHQLIADYNSATADAFNTALLSAKTTYTNNVVLMQRYVAEAATEEWKSMVSVKYNESIGKMYSIRTDFVGDLESKFNTGMEKAVENYDNDIYDYYDKEGSATTKMNSYINDMNTVFNTFREDVDALAAAKASVEISDAKGAINTYTTTTAEGFEYTSYADKFNGLLAKIKEIEKAFGNDTLPGLAYNTLHADLDKEVYSKVDAAKAQAAQAEYKVWLNGREAAEGVEAVVAQEYTYGTYLNSINKNRFKYLSDSEISGFKSDCQNVYNNTIGAAKALYAKGNAFDNMKAIKDKTLAMEDALGNVLTNATAKNVANMHTQAYDRLIAKCNDISNALKDLTAQYKALPIFGDGAKSYPGIKIDGKPFTQNQINADTLSFQSRLDEQIIDIENIKSEAANKEDIYTNAEFGTLTGLLSEINAYYDKYVVPVNTGYLNWKAQGDADKYKTDNDVTGYLENLLWKINFEIGAANEQYDYYLGKYNSLKTQCDKAADVETISKLYTEDLPALYQEIDAYVNSEATENMRVEFANLFEKLQGNIQTAINMVAASKYENVKESYAEDLDSVKNVVVTLRDDVNAAADNNTLLRDSVTYQNRYNNVLGASTGIIAGANKWQANEEAWTRINEDIDNFISTVYDPVYTKIIVDYAPIATGWKRYDNFAYDLETNIKANQIEVIRQGFANSHDTGDLTAKSNVSNDVKASWRDQINDIMASADELWPIYQNWEAFDMVNTSCSTFKTELAERLKYISDNYAQDVSNKYNSNHDDYKIIEKAINDLESAASDSYNGGTAVADKAKTFDAEVKKIQGLIDAFSKAAEDAQNAWLADQVIPGDVDLDNEVTAADYTALRRMIVGDMDIPSDPQSKPFRSADVNGDQAIDVSDVVGLANILKGYKFDGSSKTRVRSLTYQSNEALTLNYVENGLFAIALDNSREYVGFQMDIQLPEGMRIVEASLADRAANLDLMTGENSEGAFRLLASSISNEALGDKTGSLVILAVETDGTYAGGDITVDATFADLVGNKYVLSAVSTAADEATGIAANGIVTRTAYKIYNMGGQMVQKVKNGINILVGEDGSAKKVLKK